MCLVTTAISSCGSMKPELSVSRIWKAWYTLSSYTSDTNHNFVALGTQCWKQVDGGQEATWQLKLLWNMTYEALGSTWVLEKVLFPLRWGACCLSRVWVHACFKSLWGGDAYTLYHLPSQDEHVPFCRGTDALPLVSKQLPHPIPPVLTEPARTLDSLLSWVVAAMNSS